MHALLKVASIPSFLLESKLLWRGYDPCRFPGKTKNLTFPFFLTVENPKNKSLELMNEGRPLSEMSEYEGAIPVGIHQDIERVVNLLEQARTDYSDRGLVLDVDRPDPLVTATSLLRTVLAHQKKGEKRSLASLYIGVLLGALIGVIGNFFVSFWFQPLTNWNISGLVATGTVLVLLTTALFFQVRKYTT